VPKSDLHGHETILIVEDQSDVRKLATTGLEHYGYNVLSAANGPEALTISKGYLETIHLLLTDIVMPGLTGSDLAQLLRGQRPSLQVLFMSGYTEGALSHSEVLDSRFGYVQKPFTPESLAEKVREVLGPVDARATILVVNEDERVRRMLRKILTADRYAVVEAVNRRQALEYVTEGTVFDLVIIDLLLLDQEDREPIDTMKRRLPGVKIIAISEAPRADVFNVATELNFDVCLQGPLNREDLTHTVQRLLAEKRAITETG
jgi:CheY-like chemotaxis protein